MKMKAAGRMVGKALGVIIVAALAACSSGGDDDAPKFPADVPTGGEKYNVLVRREALGIPHVKANNFASLGYGLGYAQAEDNLCTLLDDIVTDRGERARYFGADGTYSIPANGVTAKNVDSDFFWKLVIRQDAIDHLRSVSLPEAKAATTGFKDGFNRYVGEIKAGKHEGRHAACRDADWLFELADDDMYRRYLRLAVIASSSVFINDVANAQPPPTGGGSSGAAPTAAQLTETLRNSDLGALAFFSSERNFGSNMYALGPQATSNGIPMVFGNPHFPWSGTERLYIFHATVPGQLDIMGSALYGVPAVNIGFTDKFAWSHTVSTAYRFTFYELTLAPDDPTSYMYDGAAIPMTPVPLTVQVKQEDGSLKDETRTLYRSKYGPMMTLTVVQQGQKVNIFPWSTTKAYTLRDANFENDRLINQFFKWNTAQSLDDFVALHASVLGIPWVNTVASGPGGKAYYGDVSVVPNVTDAKASECGKSAQAQALAAVLPGLPVLDGNTSACEWGTDEDAPAPGIFGPANLPKIQRDDWVHNCNDSYWLTNPAAPIDKHAKIIGPWQTERSLRTRLCMLHVLRHLDQPLKDGLGTTFDANGDKKFDLKELQETVLSSQIYSAQLARDDVTADLCNPTGFVMTQSGPVEVTDACTVLTNWTLDDNLASVGGHIWREFFTATSGVNGRWSTSFSVADPVNTPNGLNVTHPQVQNAFGLAVKTIQDRGHALDAPIGELQYSGVIGDNFVPIFGGVGGEGAFTIVSNKGVAGSTGTLHPKTDTDRGGYKVVYGNSYIQTVTWESEGTGFKPVAEGFITYSESTDPASPHFFDYTKEYSAKRWHRFPFREAEVQAATVEALTLTE
jgi:acyl-homoserine-lactone acylase